MNTNNMIYELELTSDQLENIFGVSHMTLYRWRNDGLPFIKKGKNVRFKLSDVEAWLEENNIRISYRKLKG